MNKALLLLLVALVQCQSDGIFLPSQSNSDKYDENVDDFQVEDWQNSESPYSVGLNKNYYENSQPVEKRSTSDVLTRRSALDKNFMRFGRNSGISFPKENSGRSGLPVTNTNFFRFGRGYKDSFIRFGRGAQDNFLRFGRGAQDNFIRFGRGAKDNFIRFGRGAKDKFIRFGRVGYDDFFRSGKSGRENFIRFGRVDKNFMRFGRGKTENDDEQENLNNQDYFSHLQDTTGKYNEIFGSFERVGKSAGKPDNFIRFGKNGNQKEGRNGTNFLRFGRKIDPEVDTIETDDADLDPGNHDLSGDTLKYGPVMRIKRQTMNTDNISENKGNKNKKKEVDVEKFKSNSENGVASNKKTEDNEKRSHQLNKPRNDKIFNKRSIGFFEEMPDNFPRSLSPVLVSSSWQNLKNLKNSRLIPFFPASSKTPFYYSNPKFFVMGRNAESKRDKGGSNFIRFG